MAIDTVGRTDVLGAAKAAPEKDGRKEKDPTKANIVDVSFSKLVVQLSWKRKTIDAGECVEWRSDSRVVDEKMETSYKVKVSRRRYQGNGVECTCDECMGRR